MPVSSPTVSAHAIFHYNNNSVATPFHCIGNWGSYSSACIPARKYWVTCDVINKIKVETEEKKGAKKEKIRV